MPIEPTTPIQQMGRATQTQSPSPSPPPTVIGGTPITNPFTAIPSPNHLPLPGSTSHISAQLLSAIGTNATISRQSSRASASSSLSNTPQTSPPLRPIQPHPFHTRDPVRITTSPNYSPESVTSSSSAPIGSLSAKSKSERTRLLDDNFRLRDASEGEDEGSDDEKIAAIRAKGPFIVHSYQTFPSSTSGSTAASPGQSSSTDPIAPTSEISKSARLAKALLLPCAILLSVCNSITWKRMLNRYASIDGSHRNLEFFVNQWTLLLYTVACGIVFMYRWFFTDLITPEQRGYPQRRFALMGCLDAISGLFGAVGGSITAGQVQIVINQANIPITMLFSRIYLNAISYTWSQYLGAGVIIAGGLVSAFGTAGEESQHVIWYGSLLIFIAVIPGSMSNVYKEENFKEHNLDVFYLSTYVSIWQGLFSFACVPLFTLSYFGGIPMSDMPQNLLDGYHCFLGHYLSGYACEDPYPSSSALVFMFVAANFAYNLALLSMVKHGSALFLVIACAMALPLTNLVFTLNWVMGEDVESFSMYNMIGLALVVIGFLLYSLVPDAPESGEFMVPTGPAIGHGMYMTEYFPSISELDYYYGGTKEPVRRHSFDFHSSPSIRSINDARKQRVKRAMGNRTPSRTP